jgi:FdhD protein
MNVTDVHLVRVRDGRREPACDRAAAEEPLEIRLNGRRFVVIMRTPGADRELAAGFLLGEGVIRTADEIGAIEHCRDLGGAAENVVNVTLAGDGSVVENALAERRQVTLNSSCGLCGRLSIDSLKNDRSPLAAGGGLSSELVVTLPGRLREVQEVFDVTGGLHAAGLFNMNGLPTASAEDVGRHNAVDKVVGRMLMHEALPLTSETLFVSGRTSFEIVQKAWFAGIPIVASVSAPSSLAIELARQARITLVGFVRDGGFNIYTHPERIA